MDIFQFILNLWFAFVSAFLSVELAKLLKQNGRVLEKLDEGLRRMDEGFRRMDEGFRRMDEGLRRMDEGFKLIARLIVEKNEETKKEILAALAK